MRLPFLRSTYDEAIAAYYPDQEIKESEQISIGVHAVVENGAVVPSQG